LAFVGEWREWESGRVGEWESGTAGQRDSGTAGEWREWREIEVELGF